MAVLLILFSIRMKLLSFDIVNFGFPQSLENMLYDFKWQQMSLSETNECHI